jgi:hypothetical protein
MKQNTGNYMNIDAFNLWKGAVFAEQDNWDDGSLLVVTKVIRLHDTEEVVVLHRHLNYAVMYEGAMQNPATTQPPSQGCSILNFNLGVRVYGNVVTPNDLGDDNSGNNDLRKA